MEVKDILSRCSLTRHENKDCRRERSIRMDSLADEDAGVVFWEDFCDLHGWPRMPNSTNIRRYTEEFVNHKEKSINRRWGGAMGYIGGYDLFLKPVLRLRDRLLDDNNIGSHSATFATLPPELHAMIVSFLDSAQDIYSCTLVSRDWHNILNPFLWDNIKSYCTTKDPQKESPFISSIVDSGSLRKYGHHIQTLKIECSNDGLNDFVTMAPDRFLRLHSIDLRVFELSDDTMADLLHRCSQRCGGVGLRRIVLTDLDDLFWATGNDNLGFGLKSAEALKEHFPTLEVFCAEVSELPSKKIQELLCSASRLRVFNILKKDRIEPVDNFCTSLKASDAVRTNWACESLEVFGCPILGIPQLDFTQTRQEGKKDKGQKKSIVLHHGVYSQLARLTHLEELRLGIPYDTSSMSYCLRDKEYARQYDCLAMSLESGLNLLSGLKKLRVVALEDMEVGIDGESEQEWVREHWPMAKIITTFSGTDRDDDSQLSGDPGYFDLGYHEPGDFDAYECDYDDVYF